nr:response regulator [Clostridium sp. UBA6640]
MNNNINILVVEDDNDINKMLAKLVERNGYNVRQAYSGTEAMLHIDNTDFHLVLLDLMLPGITGEELLKNIRKTKKMPVIVILAKLEKQVKLDLFKLGADDYITKPFDIEELSARINANLRRYIDFNNSSPDKNRSGKGTGLGLSIVKSLIEKINGTIEADKCGDMLNIYCRFKVHKLC